MPAFGALTGGLDIGEAPISKLFEGEPAEAFLLGRDRLHRLPLHALG